MWNARGHISWAVMLAASIAIAFLGDPLIERVKSSAMQKYTKLQSEHSKLSQAIEQLHQDAAEAERLKAEIDPDIAYDILSPVNRIRSSELIEIIAAKHGLSNIAYSFSPEEKVSVQSTFSRGMTLYQTKWTISAEAATDTDIYAFIDEVRKSMQGKFSFRRLSIERINTADGRITEANIKTSLMGNWLSNGSEPLAQGFNE